MKIFLNKQQICYGTAQVQRRTRSKNFIELRYSLDTEMSEYRGQSQLDARIATSTRLFKYSISKIAMTQV